MLRFSDFQGMKTFLGAFFVFGAFAMFVVDRLVLPRDAENSYVVTIPDAPQATLQAPAPSPSASIKAEASDPVAGSQVRSSDPRIINSIHELLDIERSWPGTLAWSVANVGKARTLFEFNHNNSCPQLRMVEEKSICNFDRPIFADNLGSMTAVTPVVRRHGGADRPAAN